MSGAEALMVVHSWRSRRVLTQFAAAIRTRPAGRVRGTVCTGKIFYPYLKGSVDRLGMDLKTVAVESKFWGPGIGVAGLLTGTDFIAALKGDVYGDFVVLPSESMVGDQYLFLDDLTIKDIEKGIIASDLGLAPFGAVLARKNGVEKAYVFAGD